MNRESKAKKVDDLKDTFAKAKFAVVADYRGLKVNEFEQLRASLREQGGQIQVAKNTLLKLAVQDTDFEGLTQDFAGTTAVAVSFDDPVGSAKALADFTKDNEALVVRSAVFEGKMLSSDDLVALSKLPSKDQLLGQLCSVLNAVPTKLVRTLNAAPSNLVYALQAIKEQKEN
ncbi:MAG: 50S ribosomal protein L10 [Candidatus Electrothrix sp. AW2]|nr:50S ribosomal protein L10 [Candidatus Electrothrix gigas]MCI5135294.1 50S ribosomal protein L10 [Candidatus Electrothrix gigas]MCI5180554.1 50S ribosomal protein L10 [Candidatus Electrothrix gigas]MCI5189666.1 50S ribosomal protein L10 [Candidatus Electrothrix gigas]MCI5194146.1 50S ribosomal protein L10 [Candidatus Electrothrix gigas]